MPNIIDADGLQTATQAELLTYYTTKLQAIYGADINLNSDTPDGQWVNILIQTVLDLQDLLTQIYNSFDPDSAIGVVLDQRVAINGIQRQAGTFSVTNVTLVLTQSVNLYGLDQEAQQIFTVSDNAGNQWQLQTTQLGVGPGTVSYAFQAVTPGANLTTPNTITVPVTIVLGVQSINNPSAQTTVGLNEESDATLKIRRQQSVSIGSQGYLAGLLAALQNIPGVSSAFVYENNTSSTDGDGVPGHSIWVIVAGTAAAEDIANAIYTKRNAGCGLFGSTSYPIVQVDGSTFIVNWDTVSPQNLYIAFTATSINGTNQPNIAAIVAGLPALFVPGVAAEVNINTLATLVQQIDPNTLVTLAGFSTALSQILILSGVPASGTFMIRYNGNNTAAINWNDSTATIQSKLQSVTGLADATVSGTLAGQTLTITLGVTSALSLLTVTSNSLQTSGPMAITFLYQESYQNILSPLSNKYQFAVASSQIVVLPMILTPVTSTVSRNATQQFTGVGGYGTLVYSMQANPSGGAINSSTGLYTAGASTGADIAKVTDSMGNTATAAITVV